MTQSNWRQMRLVCWVVNILAEVVAQIDRWYWILHIFGAVPYRRSCDLGRHSLVRWGGTCGAIKNILCGSTLFSWGGSSNGDTRTTNIL